MSKVVRFYELAGIEPSGFDPAHRYFTSWLFGPLVLASIRALFSLYAFVTLFTVFGWADSHGNALGARQSFSYFTYLTYWGLAFYMAFSAAHGFAYALRGEPFITSWPRPLQALHCLYYSTVTTYPFIVTIVYWGIIFGGFTTEFSVWQNLSQHGFNSLYALFEIVVPSTSPTPWLHLGGDTLILALYLSLAYLTKATEGFYPYSFLDVSKGSGMVAAYCFGILAAIIVIFLIVNGVIWVRRRFTGLGKRSTRDQRGVDGIVSETPMDIEMGSNEK